MLRICSNQTHLFCLSVSHCGGGIELSVILELSATLAEAFNSLFIFRNFSHCDGLVEISFMYRCFRHWARDAELSFLCWNSSNVAEASTLHSMCISFSHCCRRRWTLRYFRIRFSHCGGGVQISFLFSEVSATVADSLKFLLCTDVSDTGVETLNSLFCAEIHQM